MRTPDMTPLWSPGLKSGRSGADAVICIDALSPVNKRDLNLTEQVKLVKDKVKGAVDKVEIQTKLQEDNRDMMEEHKEKALLVEICLKEEMKGIKKSVTETHEEMTAGFDKVKEVESEAQSDMNECQKRIEGTMDADRVVSREAHRELLKLLRGTQEMSRSRQRDRTTHTGMYQRKQRKATPSITIYIHNSHPLGKLETRRSRA